MARACKCLACRGGLVTIVIHVALYLSPVGQTRIDAESSRRRHRPVHGKNRGH